MVVGAMRSAYRGYTDPDCPRPLRRLFERTVDVANPFDGAAPRRRTPPPVGGDTTGPKKCSLLQWLFEGPYDAAFDATGEGYVPELAYHAYRTRGGVDRGRDASLPGGPTDPAVVADLLAADPAAVWTWFLRTALADAPGLRRVAAASYQAHRAPPPAEPPAYGVDVVGCLDSEPARRLVAGLCDGKVPHALFDSCGGFAPPTPRAPTFAVTLVLPGAPALPPRRGDAARVVVVGPDDAKAWTGPNATRGPALRDRLDALLPGLAPPAAFAGCAQTYPPDPPPPPRVPFDHPTLRLRRPAAAVVPAPSLALVYGLLVLAAAFFLARRSCRWALADQTPTEGGGDDDDRLDAAEQHRVDSDDSDDGGEGESPEGASLLQLEPKTPKKRK